MERVKIRVVAKDIPSLELSDDRSKKSSFCFIVILNIHNLGRVKRLKWR
jgi:hypothetical protein